MTGYKIVKYCGLCRERFVVPKGRSRDYYCQKCLKKVLKDQNNSEEIK